MWQLNATVDEKNKNIEPGKSENFTYTLTALNVHSEENAATKIEGKVCYEKGTSIKGAYTFTGSFYVGGTKDTFQFTDTTVHKGNKAYFSVAKKEAEHDFVCTTNSLEPVISWEADLAGLPDKEENINRGTLTFKATDINYSPAPKAAIYDKATGKKVADISKDGDSCQFTLSKTLEEGLESKNFTDTFYIMDSDGRKYNEASVTVTLKAEKKEQPGGDQQPGGNTGGHGRRPKPRPAVTIQETPTPLANNTETTITENEVPLANAPVTEIAENEVPLASAPVASEEVTIEDEKTPLAALPQTSGLGIGIFALAGSMLAGLGFALLRRKEEK